MTRPPLISALALIAVLGGGLVASAQTTSTPAVPDATGQTGTAATDQPAAPAAGTDADQPMTKRPGKHQARGDGMPGAMAEMMWQTLDQNGDGKVTPDEVAAAAKARFDAADSNGDGTLSADELAAQAQKMEQERQAAMRLQRGTAMIARFDKNGDGQLSADEMPGSQIGDRLFKRADTDGDGTVSKAEFDAAARKMQARFGHRDNGQRDHGRQDRGHRHHGRGDDRSGENR